MHILRTGFARAKTSGLSFWPRLFFGFFLAVSYSASAQVTPKITVPSSDTDGDFFVTWAEIAGVTRYEVWRKQKVNGTWANWGPKYDQIYDAELAQNDLVDSEYLYVVRSCDGPASTDCGGFGPATPILVQRPPNLTGKPTGFTVPKVDGDGTFTVSWEPIVGATGYDLWRATHNGSDWDSWSYAITTSDIKHEQSNLPTGQYRYVVRESCATPCPFTGALAVTVQPSAGQETVFSHPPGIDTFSDYRVFVNGQEVFVYKDYRRNLASSDLSLVVPTSEQGFAIFDFSGQVDIQILVNPALLTQPENFKIAPAKLRVAPHINAVNNSISFTIDDPGHLTLDPFGNGTKVLHLFTNAPEINPPTASNPNLIYYGPGVHLVDEQILLTGDNPPPNQPNGPKSLYLAGGAVLKPLITVDKDGDPCEQTLHISSGNLYGKCPEAIKAIGDNITISGRGVISGDRALLNGVRFPLIKSNRGTNVVIKDIVLSKGTLWNLHLFDCTSCEVDNVRVLGYFSNTDGILLNSSNMSTVRNSFVHVADDGLEVKAIEPSSEIHFVNSQTWVDVGTPMGITHEISSVIDGVTFEDITVLRYTHPDTGETIPYRSTILIRPALGGSVNNITFHNITIEDHDTDRPLIMIYNSPDINVSGASFSPVTNVLFNNVNATSTRLGTRVMAYDLMGGLYDNIRFHKLKINGETLDENSPWLHEAGNPELLFGTPPGC